MPVRVCIMHEISAEKAGRRLLEIPVEAIRGCERLVPDAVRLLMGAHKVESSFV